MAWMTHTFRDVVWDRRGVCGWAAWLALQPASAVFAAGVASRNLGYRLGILRAHRAGIAVVSVGNLSVGGTGKTPMTLWLARQLGARGVKVAILLRGYSGRARTATIVSRGADPRGANAPGPNRSGGTPEVDVETAGDEAVMLAKSFEGVVLTARHRIDGVALAEQLGCQVVVLDDGFQHRALVRDFDLVLLSGRDGTLLPAGPMRERRSALKRADAVALVVKADEDVPDAGRVGRAKPQFVVHFAARALVESDGGRWRELPMDLLTGRRIAVVAGVAHPTPFYDAVRRWEAQIEEIFEYPDHYRYTQADWQQLSRATRAVELIVTTEKDLVKLEHFPFAKGKLVALRIVPEVDGGDVLVRLVMERARLTPAA
jgi:tetraacyldisaccharide 4'-kinase